MGRYEVMSERVLMTTSRIEADNEYEALSKYHKGEVLQSIEDVDEDAVLSIMEVDE